MTATLFLVGLIAMAGWGLFCFWLAVRHRRRQLALGRKPNPLVIRNFVVAGAGCGIMFFVLIFLTLNPPPASLDTMRP